MMYSSWDMKHDGQNLLSFWTIFCLFTPLTTQNIKIMKKSTKCWRYHFTHVYHKLQLHDVWFLRYQAQQTKFFVILDNILPIYPLKTWKMNFLKKNEKKNTRTYYHFTQVCQKSASYAILLLRYGMCQR